MPERRPPRSIEDAQRELERLRREVERTRQDADRLREENARLERERDRLRREIERLTQALEAARRAGTRQAAPFSKGARRPRHGARGAGRVDSTAGMDIVSPLPTSTRRSTYRCRRRVPIAGVG